jgi:quercetin dioxygenase-like cupin family protein
MTETESSAGASEAVVPCDRIEEAVSLFTERLGYRLLAIRPSDDPQVAIVEGHGARVRLQRREGATHPYAPLAVPNVPVSFALSRADEGARWTEGRAGMRYRDLVPGRQGGLVVASQIRIEGGGPVHDYVHFHDVRLQLIYCARGWVKVVYEDQGPPFVLREGDCVLQPPRIRHRVLESSAGLEVVEVTSPADHGTFVDHDLELPTAQVRPDREYAGQRFVRHEAASAAWEPWPKAGFEARDLGVAAATSGLAFARVARPRGAPDVGVSARLPVPVFVFVLGGDVTLRCEGRAEALLEVSIPTCA